MTREQLAQVLGEQEKSGSALDSLGNRELEVLSLMSQGQSGRQICDELQLTREELAELKAGIQKKCGLKDEVQLVRFAARQRESQI